MQGRENKQLAWITPDWGRSLDACDMPFYGRICNRVEVVEGRV